MSRVQLAALLDALPVAVCLVDETLCLQAANAALLALCIPYPADELAHRAISTLGTPAGQQIAEVCTRVLAGGAAERDIVLSPSTGLGEGRRLLLTVLPLVTIAPEPPLVACVLVDATERVEAERLARELEAGKTTFIATVSHELRTPLTSIKGFVHALRSRGPRMDPTRRDEYLLIIESQTDYLSGIVDELLALAQLEERHLRLQLLELELVPLFHRVVASLGPRATGHAIAVDAEPSLPRAMADPLRVEQVVRALLANALVYAPPGSPIRISAMAADGMLRVRVTDTGIGIPRARHGELFQRFSRIDNSITRATRGLGLGLYFARSLVEAMGGTIWVESEEGHGATFIFTLPTGA